MQETFLDQAKRMAADALSTNALKQAGALRGAPIVKADDCYVVWFAKELQNWKALVSTGKIAPADKYGNYVEVTHNGDKNETYCDVYKKQMNICYADK